MMAKTVKQNFVDSQLRTLVERLESVDVRIETLLLDWNGDVAAMFANDSTPYDDGREGRRQFDEALVHTAVEKLVEIQAILAVLRPGLRTIAVQERSA